MLGLDSILEGDAAAKEFNHEMVSLWSFWAWRVSTPMFNVFKTCLSKAEEYEGLQVVNCEVTYWTSIICLQLMFVLSAILCLCSGYLAALG